MWNLQKHEHQKYFWNYVTVLQVKSSSGRKPVCKQQWKLVCGFVDLTSYMSLSSP